MSKIFFDTFANVQFDLGNQVVNAFGIATLDTNGEIDDFDGICEHGSGAIIKRGTKTFDYDTQDLCAGNMTTFMAVDAAIKQTFDTDREKSYTYLKNTIASSDSKFFKLIIARNVVKR